MDTPTTGATSTGPATSQVAAEESKQVAATAAEQGQQVAGAAAQHAGAVAGTAKEQAGQVVQEVAAQGANVLAEVKTQLSQQAQTQTQQLADRVRQMGEQVRALAEGRTEEAGPLRNQARRAADRLSSTAGRLDDRGFEGLVEDLQRFARRRPAVFLAGAAAAGMIAGRLFRGIQAASSDSGQSQAMMTPALPPPVTTPVPATVTEYPVDDAVDLGYGAPEPVYGDVEPALPPASAGTGSFFDDPETDVTREGGV